MSLLDVAVRLSDVNTCACGAPATANDRECPVHFLERIGSISHMVSSPASNRRWDNRLERYRATRAEGSQPTSTRTRDIDAARAASDETGQAFRADMWSAPRG